MRVLLSLCCCLFFSSSFAQTCELNALSEGELLGMNALFDEKGDLFGYISMYDYGKVSDKARKFEYVVLDKNLNPLANNTFEGDLTAGNYRGSINFNGKIVLTPRSMDYTFVPKKDAYYPASMEIDLATNTVKKKVFYDFDHGAFKEKEQHEAWSQIKKENKAEKKENGFNYISSLVEVKEGGFWVVDYEHHGSYNKNVRMMRFDENKKELWTYGYNTNGSKSESQVFYYLDKDENYIYSLLSHQKKKEMTHYLLVLDWATGKEVHKKEIADPDKLLPSIMSFPTYAYGHLSNKKTFDDKIVVVGQKIKLGWLTGFSRLIINKKTFATDLKLLTYEDDFSRHVPDLDKRGLTDAEYTLDPRDIIIQEDGSVAMLFEKITSIGSDIKTSDLVYVYTNRFFDIVGARGLKKAKSNLKNSDYLFSQRLNDDKDLVFFYRDYQKDDETKDKNWNLFINTVIDGNFKQEIIPIPSKNGYRTLPYVAKEGYILLEEFNNKVKYCQIRLERLNY